MQSATSQYAKSAQEPFVALFCNNLAGHTMQKSCKVIEPLKNEYSLSWELMHQLGSSDYILDNPIREFSIRTMERIIMIPSTKWLNNAEDFAKNNGLLEIAQKAIKEIPVYINGISKIEIEEWFDPEEYGKPELSFQIYVEGDYSETLDKTNCFLKRIGNSLIEKSNYKVSFVPWPI